MMPHIERSTFQWNWAHYQRINDEVSPWHEAFVNKKWIDKKKLFFIYKSVLERERFFLKSI
jgi:hypothetical protein